MNQKSIGHWLLDIGLWMVVTKCHSTPDIQSNYFLLIDFGLEPFLKYKDRNLLVVSFLSGRRQVFSHKAGTATAITKLSIVTQILCQES